jgi:hypothetical protein
MTEWVAGAEVVFMSNGWGGKIYGRRDTIAKVYKTGNFTLAGEDGQWRQNGGGASRAGQRGGYSSRRLYLVTPEVEADILLVEGGCAAKKTISDEIDRLGKLVRNGTDEERIAEAKRIADQVPNMEENTNEA